MDMTRRCNISFYVWLFVCSAGIIKCNNSLMSNDSSRCLNGAVELHQNSISEKQMVIYNRQFTSLESIFGNTHTFVYCSKKSRINY